MTVAPWPKFAGGSIQNSTFQGYHNDMTTDNSVLGNIISGDFFLRITAPNVMPFISYTDTDGFVGMHGHTLNGTKFFT